MQSPWMASPRAFRGVGGLGGWGIGFAAARSTNTAQKARGLAIRGLWTHGPGDRQSMGWVAADCFIAGAVITETRLGSRPGADAIALNGAARWSPPGRAGRLSPGLDHAVLIA